MPDFAAGLRDDLRQETADSLLADSLPADHGPVVMVAVASLRIAGSPRTTGENLEHVRVLAETTDELPPIVVHRTTMRVIDGVHRVRAARVREQREIAARFFDGDDADAFVLAVRANVAHGLPLSPTDRKAAATHILASHPHWSDRLIASVTGLSPKTIAEVRRDCAPAADHRTGQDGKVRPINSLEKRRIASDLMLHNPNLSLRQVARTAGISPETARAVRIRMLRGEDPVLLKRRGPKRAEEQAEPHPPAPDWPSVVHQLRTDPSLRFTDTGRALLRLMDVHAMSDGKWATIADNVPPHCRPTIAKVAGEFARAWHMFAEHLERNTAGPK